MDLKEEKIESKEVFKGKILNLFVDTVKLPNGKTSTREVVRHCKASCILAKLPSGKFFLEKQFRYPYNEEIYEFPAGKCDLDEDPMKTAYRELEEETGYQANNIVYLGKMYPSCAYTDEIIYLYYADSLVKKEQHLDEGEALNVYEYSLEEIMNLIKLDKLNDAKSLCALQFYFAKIYKNN